MITARDIHKSFGGIKVLNGVNMNVREGEIYGFIGQNGAGKTTTLDILAGLSRPDGGFCRVNGKDLSLIGYPGDLEIGYLPEEPKFYPWMTALETLEYLMDVRDPKKAQNLLSMVGLEKSEKCRTGGFSRGMKQRLGIAAALARDSKLLILDEPSSALDPEGRAHVLDLILELKEMGRTIIFSTHILSDVERVCDTVGILRDGVVAVEKPLRELKGLDDGWVYEISLEGKVGKDLLVKLKGLSCVIDVWEKKEGIRISTNGSSFIALDLMGVLVENQAGVASFHKERPSLEEIFLQEVSLK
ncbi:MAG: ABC transporter ATP-binding protein [Gudongella sp.]|nr:ABC transporter ATP-binding protein [Gudongella sp.]